jgi:hypothetical protein
MTARSPSPRRPYRQSPRQQQQQQRDRSGPRRHPRRPRRAHRGSSSWPRRDLASGRTVHLTAAAACRWRAACSESSGWRHLLEREPRRRCRGHPRCSPMQWRAQERPQLPGDRAGGSLPVLLRLVLELASFLAMRQAPCHEAVSSRSRPRYRRRRPTCQYSPPHGSTARAERGAAAWPALHDTGWQKAPAATAARAKGGPMCDYTDFLAHWNGGTL